MDTQRKILHNHESMIYQLKKKSLSEQSFPEMEHQISSFSNLSIYNVWSSSSLADMGPPSFFQVVSHIPQDRHFLPKVIARCPSNCSRFMHIFFTRQIVHIVLWRLFRADMKFNLMMNWMPCNITVKVSFVTHWSFPMEAAAIRASKWLCRALG